MWITEALVLVVQDTTCRNCGADYSAPSGTFKVLLRDEATDGTRLVSPTQAQWQDAQINLPRHIRRVSQHVPYCPACFERDAPTGTAPRRRLTTAEIEAERRPTLPDFGTFHPAHARSRE